MPSPLHYPRRATHRLAPSAAPPLRPDPELVLASGLLFAVTGILCLSQATDAWSMRLLATTSVLAACTFLLRAASRVGRSNDIGLCVLILATIFWFYAPAASTAFTDEQWYQRAARLRIDNAHALKAFLALNLFTFVLVTAYQFRFRRSFSASLRPLLGHDRWPSGRRIVTFLAACSIISCAFYAVLSGGVAGALSNFLASRTVHKPWDSQGNYGTALSPWHILCTGALVFAASFGFHVLVQKRIRAISARALVFSVALLSAAIVILESGTRSVTLQVVAPATLLYFRERIAGQLLRRAPRLLPILALGVVMLSLANFQLAHRSGVQIEGTVPDVEIQHNDFFTMTAFGFAAQEQLGYYLYDSALLLIATGPVPRVLWPGKPEPSVVVEFSSAYWGIDITLHGSNTMPSLLGQYFMSWGWFGILEIAAGLGLVVKLGDTFSGTVSRTSPLLFSYAAFLTYLFVGFRFLGLNFFPTFAFSAIFVWLLTRRTQSTPSDLPRLLGSSQL